MKKRSIWTKILLITLILLSVFIFASCNAEEPDESESSSAAGNDECEHSFSDWKITKEPKCENGSRERVCSKCEEKEIEVLDAIQDHTFGEWQIVKAASCQNGEERRRKCNTCSLVIDEKDEEKGFHVYNAELVCASCSQKASKGLTYTLSDDKKYYVLSGIGECKDEKVVVLDSYEKLPVLVIKEGAFENNTTVKEFVLPETLTEIGARAFKGCTAVTTMSVPEKVVKIGVSAFEGCSALTSITVPFAGAEKNGTQNTHFGYIFGAANADGNNASLPDKLVTVKLVGAESVGAFAFNGCEKLTALDLGADLKTIGDSAFTECDSLKMVAIPATVTAIGQMAFYGCDALEGVTLNEGTKSIGDYAFAKCVALKTVTLPATMELIEDDAFAGCTAMTALTFKGNALTKIGNSAFEGCAALKIVNLPEGLKSVGDNAFAFCAGIETLKIATTVKDIWDSAFEGCIAIKSVSIPKSVTVIGEAAFAGCTALETLTFEAGAEIAVIENEAFSGCSALVTVDYFGTEDEWNAVSKGTDWDKSTGEYTINYAD